MYAYTMYIVHVHDVEYGMIVSIVLWYMLCDGFTYFSQRVGVTTTLPDRVPGYLPLRDAGPHEWTYLGQSLWHDGSETNFPHLPSLHKLSTHQTVDLLISTNGQLHMCIDGRHSECIASGLPVNKPLFGAVDVRNNCIKIKSEFLSGELDGVYIHVHVYLYMLVNYANIDTSLIIQ